MEKTRSSGFTIIERMVVVAVIAVVMAISVPNVLAARVSANESAAIANLRTLSSAQAPYQAAVRADIDADGLGESGTLSEMGGARGVRIAADGTAAVEPLNAGAAFDAAFPLNTIDGDVAIGAVAADGGLWTLAQ